MTNGEPLPAVRACEQFIHECGVSLAAQGFVADPAQVERSGGRIVFYHYTRPDRRDGILAPGGGLWARLSVPTGEDVPRFAGHFLVEGFLEPLPSWVSASPYFGDLAREMMREYVGSLLLRIAVPVDFPGLYVADYAHVLECKHLQRRGCPALDLGYDCSTGREVTAAFVNSYVSAASYRGGHVAPNVQCVRRGEGIAVPSEYISVHAEQPLAGTWQTDL